MGYTKHHAMLITGMEESVRTMHEVAASIFPGGISDVNGPATNYYYSFAVYPDGSKEYWTLSDQGNEHRARFKHALRESEGCSWVEVSYGDEDGPARIVEEG